MSYRFACVRDESCAKSSPGEILPGIEIYSLYIDEISRKEHTQEQGGKVPFECGTRWPLIPLSHMEDKLHHDGYQ